MTDWTCRPFTDGGYKHVSSLVMGDVHHDFLQRRQTNARIYLQADDGRFLQNTAHPQPH